MRINTIKHLLNLGLSLMKNKCKCGAKKEIGLKTCYPCISKNKNDTCAIANCIKNNKNPFAFCLHHYTKYLVALSKKPTINSESWPNTLS